MIGDGKNGKEEQEQRDEDDEDDEDNEDDEDDEDEKEECSSGMPFDPWAKIRYNTHDLQLPQARRECGWV